MKALEGAVLSSSCRDATGSHKKSCSKKRKGLDLRFLFIGESAGAQVRSGGFVTRGTHVA